MTTTHLEHGKSAAADFDPANYRYVMSGYNGDSDRTLDSLEYSPFEHQMVDRAQEQEPVSGLNSNFCGGRCQHCGKFLKWFVMFKDVRTDLLLITGITCCNDLHLEDKGAFKRKAIQARLVKARANSKFDLQFPGLRAELQRVNNELAASGRHDNFFMDLNCSLNRYGSLSVNQAQALKRSLARHLSYVEEKAKRDAAKAIADAAAPDAPSGRVVVTGKVLSTKWQDNDFGGSLKMLVEDDRGFRCWGTVPSSITVERWTRVTFTATLEVSAKDRLFTFFKRPSKAAVLPPLA